MEVGEQHQPATQCYLREEQPLESCSLQDRLRHSSGTLGPVSDLTGGEAGRPFAKKLTGVGSAVVVAVGITLAVLVANVQNARSVQHSAQGNAPTQASAENRTQLNQLNPQKQAESLLELAIGSSEDANQEIASRVDVWRGKLSLDSQLATLTTAALNSNDLSVRQSGLEVQLAAYGLAKNASTVDVLIQTAASAGHSKKIWAIWVLGALANRGVEAARVEQVLVSHLDDADEDSRQWAVQGLALVGTTATIAPLLAAMHDDPSPSVRESAASSLAEGGMLSHEQRLAAVPQLVNYTADASLDSQTHVLAFQALGDITKERLPNDSAAWRSWYASAKGE
jgi:HEAT repeat protein